MENRQLRWAVVGTSFISGVMVDAIRASRKGEVYCVAGRNPANVDSFASKHNICRKYYSYDEVLHDSAVDVVYIGLPTLLHAEWTKKCAIAGKHILCEKSFTLNSKQCLDTLSVVQEHNVFCMEAQMYRCHPLIRRLQEVIISHPVGKVLSVNATFTAPIIDLFNRSAGGAILDLGCYPMSLLRLLCGEPVAISGTSTLTPPQENSSDDVFDMESIALIEFSNEIRGNIRVCNNEELTWKFVVVCENGYIELSNLWDNTTPDSITITSSSGGNEVVVEPTEGDFYVMQIDTVNDCIRAGRVQAFPPAMTWQDTENNVRALDMWRTAVGLRYRAEAS